LVITPDGHLLGRFEGNESFEAFLGEEGDLIRSIHGVTALVELDGDEIGYMVAKVAKLKRQR
jgi:hypothetical protein